MLCSVRNSGCMKSGSGFSATGSEGSTTVSSVPSSTSPSITPMLTPASRAASPLPRIMPSARSSSTRARAAVMRRRRRAGKLDASALALRAEMLAHAQAHAQHHAARRHGVIGHPIDEAAQLRPQRRHIEFFLDVLEPIIEPRIGLRVLRPHHGGGLARAQWHRHHVARSEVQLLRHPVRIGPVERDRDQHIDDASGHAGILGRFRGV